MIPAGHTDVAATMRWLLAIGLACGVSLAQAAGDPFGWHYSPSTHVTPANVDRLEPAWTHRNGDMAATIGQPSSVSAQSTPILLPRSAGEHLVYCTPFNRVIALDPATGRERWTYDPQVPRTSERPYRCRGVAYAEVPQVDARSACRHRIYTATNDRRLIALDARDGRPCAAFGTNGVVDLVEHERDGLERVGHEFAARRGEWRGRRRLVGDRLRVRRGTARRRSPHTTPSRVRRAGVSTRCRA